MEFQELIEKRRIVREYDGTKKVTEEQVKNIVAAAIEAPSWKNAQTSRYYCILSDEIRKEFLKECLPEFNANSAENAALVVTSFVKDRVGFNRNTGEADNECGNGWGYYDLGLHNADFILKAKDMGLDTLIMGLRDSDKIRDLLNIPQSETIVSVIALGYAKGQSEKPKRKSVEDILTLY